MDDDGNRVRLLHASLAEAPPFIADDAPLRAALNEGGPFVCCDAGMAVCAEVALPLLPYHGTEAFVLVASRSGGDPLNDDEIETLRGVVPKLGHYFQVARLASLRVKGSRRSIDGCPDTVHLALPHHAGVGVAPLAPVARRLTCKTAASTRPLG